MNASQLPWLLLAVVSWWMGATGAGLRRELSRLAVREGGEEPYALVARFRRLQDDPVGLALRLRVARVAAAAFVPMSLAAAVADRSLPLLGTAVIFGWLAAAGTEAAGGGPLVRKLARWRGGMAYGAWANLLYLPARIARPLRRLRELPDLREVRRAHVFAESQAALSRSGGALGRAELLFLRRLLARGGILVADVMTPWNRVAWAEADLPLAAARDRARESGHSRLPVLDGARITGLLTIKDLLGAQPSGGNGRRVRDLMRPVYFVRQEVTLDRLLEELRRARVHLAVVVDRLGRTTGLVTMEDVLEQIVGELHDERERGREGE